VADRGRKQRMSWKRLATFVAGGAAVAAGLLIPGAQAVLVPAGAGLIGLATRWPGDKPTKPKPQHRNDDGP
jgi:uncharacterized membrane protein